MNGPNGIESNGQMGLPEIIQMCCQANRSGQISYRTPERAGTIFLQHGQIIHASADGFEGAEAVFRMLGWPVGSFNFDEALLPNKRTVTQTWEQLLFEGALRADQGTPGAPLEVGGGVVAAAPVIMTRIQGGQPKLTVVAGDEIGRSFELTEEYTHLGRVLNNEITLPYPEISSRHCMFILSGTDVIARDLNSSNGTFVNGSQITEVILQLGDEVQIGPVVLKFESSVKRPKLRMPTPVAEVEPAEDKIPFHKKTAPLPKPAVGGNGAPVGDTTYLTGNRPIVYSDLQKPEGPKRKTNPLLVLLVVSMMIIIGGAGYILFFHK